MTRLDAATIHAALGLQWPSVLASLGVGETYLRLRKAGPCPACGGTDRYTFDNRRGRGDFLCRHCGPGDGFTLLMRVHHWPFAEARRRVIETAGMGAASDLPLLPPCAPDKVAKLEVAQPTWRTRKIAETTCAPADCPDAVAYLSLRGLWPLPTGCALRAHPSIPYWDEGREVGRFAGLFGIVQDRAGSMVTAHVTYLREGEKKLASNEPRKILSAMTGRAGCAVRLAPVGPVLGIAEGLETALSAWVLHGIPTWAALNASLLAKFEPPDCVDRLVVFADRDAPGLEAAGRLAESLQGRVAFELRPPPTPAKDWNDVLMQRTSKGAR